MASLKSEAIIVLHMPTGEPVYQAKDTIFLKQITTLGCGTTLLTVVKAFIGVYFFFAIIYNP